MRYPEAKIKEAILHPDPEIRDRATSYFAKSFSPDPSIMPLVIKAVETHGRQDAYRLIGLSRDLPQTEDTIAWVIDELNDEQTDQYENYAYNLSMVLVEADPALLLPRESAILEARHFLPDLRAPLTERLRMLSWDEATCWQKLEEFCEEGKDKQYTNEVNLGHANRIVEALARYGQECEEKVRAVLSQKVDDYSHHPMKWLEPLVVRLAGQAHLESTIPLLIAKLLEDGGDLLNEECAEALTRIGTPAVLHAVAEAFPTAEHHFRLYATGPLEHIHSDLAVETCLHLLGQEKEEDHSQGTGRTPSCASSPRKESRRHGNCSWAENSISRAEGCGITCWKPAPSWGNGSPNTTSGWRLRRPRRKNTGSGSRSLKATPRVCCCSPSKS